ncbi:Zinc finger protein 143 [Nymphon striatum]|nr:Zinc finger protein 143 [Nymphon striatum]
MNITVKEKSFEKIFANEHLEITEVQQAEIALLLNDEQDKNSVSSNSIEISEIEASDDTIEDQKMQEDKESRVVNVSIKTESNNELQDVSQEKATIECDVSAISEQPMNITAVTLPDGTTALVHADIENWATDNDATKYIKAQQIQFENGTTAYIRVEDYQKLLPENDIEKCSERVELLPKIVEGSTIELQDGTTAILPCDGETLGTIQLPNGTTAYISSDAQFFDTKSGNSAINLVSNLSHSSSPLTDIPVTCTLTTSDDKEMLSINSTGVIGSVKTSSGPKPFKCPVKGCNKVYAFQHHLKVHSRTHTGIRPFLCTHLSCGKTFSTGYGLKSHERIHTGEKPYKCIQESCSKAFKTSGDLQKHIRTHTGKFMHGLLKGVAIFSTENEMKIVTNAKKDTKVVFKEHAQSKKREYLELVLEIEHASFTPLVFGTNGGERPFKCDYEGCERSFTTSNIRKVHMRVHTGERPYACDVETCKKTFSSATNYKNHMRIHSGERPYACNYPDCDKRFTEYSSLYKHHVVHTMAKPYTCEICGKTYRQTSTLATHRRTYHDVIETVLHLNENGAQNISISSDLDTTDKLLADGNIIITKSTAGVNALGEDTTVVTLGENMHSLNDVQKYEILEQKECLDDKNQNEEGTSIMNIIGEAENGLGQQIYVLADSSQFSFFQNQITHGQLLATIPITSAVDGTSEIQAVIESEASDEKVEIVENMEVIEATDE